MNNPTSRPDGTISFSYQKKSFSPTATSGIHPLLLALSFICLLFVLPGCGGSPGSGKDNGTLAQYLTVNHDRFVLSVQTLPTTSTWPTIEVTNPMSVPVTITSITLNDVCMNNGIVLDYPFMNCMAPADATGRTAAFHTLQPGEKCTVSLRYGGGGHIFTDGKLTIWGGTNLTAEPKDLVSIDVLLSPQ